MVTLYLSDTIVNVILIMRAFYRVRRTRIIRVHCMRSIDRIIRYNVAYLSGGKGYGVASGTEIQTRTRTRAYP
jgi:hypothetical protein